MAYDIRPLSFSEIFDRAVCVYRDNFTLRIGIAALFWIPSAVLRACASVAGNRIVSTLDFIFFMIGEPVMGAAAVVAVASVYLNRPSSLAKLTAPFVRFCRDS